MEKLGDEAILARRSVDTSPSGVRDDPWNEDNWGDQAHTKPKERDREGGSL